jgi:hypothetical protein
MRTQYVFFDPCGCPFGVLEGSCAAGYDEAWREFYEGPHTIAAAKAQGVTVEHVSHDGYVKYFSAKMSASCVCPHQSSAVA